VSASVIRNPKGAKQVDQPDFCLWALGLFAVVAMLADCGGLEPPIGALRETPQSWAATTRDTGYARSAPLLYVGNVSGYDDVKVYPASGKDPSPIAIISDDLDTPTGDCIDGVGTLYVVNEPPGQGWVTEFAAGETKSSKIIKKGINTPAFCALDSNGNLWVTNIGGQNVTEYEKGSTKPHTIITDGLFYPDGIAFDQSGNMYVANHVTEGSNGYLPGNVVVYASGSKSPSRTITDGVVSPVGITVDATGTLYVTNLTDNNVQEYRSGQSQPYQTITEGIDTPFAVTVDKKGYLYVTDTYKSVVVEFDPGSITPSKREISKGLFEPSGTAYSPPLLPEH
jgi:sugar lactone lactonase YvrE